MGIRLMSIFEKKCIYSIWSMCIFYHQCRLPGQFKMLTGNLFSVSLSFTFELTTCLWVRQTRDVIVDRLMKLAPYNFYSDLTQTV